MDEKDFELLCVLDETKNITKAADQLFITQSALSKRIKAIETELNTDLLVRSRQGIHFTPAGEIVLHHARVAAQEMAKMRLELEQMGDEICGTLNAGISVNFSIFRLPDVLASFHRKYPKVNLKITSGHSRNLYRKLVDGEVDIAILRGQFPWDGMQFLLEQEHMCVVRSSKFKDVPLADYMYISHTTDPEQAALMAKWMHENGLSSHPAGFHMDSVTGCLESVKRGLGWALLPEIALDHFEGEKQYCYFADGEPFMRRTYILCNKDVQDFPQIRAFAEELKRNREERENK